MGSSSADITNLLKAWRQGDRGALDRLTPLVYDQLKKLARQYVRKESPDARLNATALVHEAYVRLVDARTVDWQDRAHFYAVSARIMRRILVDAARARASAKRGGGVARADHSGIDLDQVADASSERAAELCALDDALTALAQMDPRRAQVVELRFFGGLSVEETASRLRRSCATGSWRARGCRANCGADTPHRRPTKSNAKVASLDFARDALSESRRAEPAESSRFSLRIPRTLRSS